MVKKPFWTERMARKKPILMVSETRQIRHLSPLLSSLSSLSSSLARPFPGFIMLTEMCYLEQSDVLSSPCNQGLRIYMNTNKNTLKLLLIFLKHSNKKTGSCLSMVHFCNHTATSLDHDCCVCKASIKF